MSAGRPESFLRRWMDPWHLANARIREALDRSAGSATGRLLDVGCGAKPYRDLFRVERYVGVDLPAALRFSDALFETWGKKPKGPIARRWLRIVGAAAQLGGFLLEKLFGRKGDTLDNLLVARKR